MHRLLIALIALITAHSTAFAHSKMSGSEPAKGETVEVGLETVALSFDRKVRLTRVDLGAAPASMTLETLMQATEDGGIEDVEPVSLTSALPKSFVTAAEIGFEPLEAGVYVLRWIAVAQDGHTQTGIVPFAVTGTDQ